MSMEGTCTGGNGRFTGVYLFSPVVNIFAPRMSFSDADVTREDFLFYYKGMQIRSAQAKAYLWRRYNQWRDECEAAQRMQCRRDRKERDIEERIAADAVIAYRQATSKTV